MRGLGSIPTGGNIFSLDFFFCFHTVKTKMPKLAFLCVCEKSDYVTTSFLATHSDLVKHYFNSYSHNFTGTITQTLSQNFLGRAGVLLPWKMPLLKLYNPYVIQELSDL